MEYSTLTKIFTMPNNHLERQNSMQPSKKPTLLRTLSDLQYPRNRHLVPGSISNENQSLSLDKAKDKNYWQKTLQEAFSREKYFRESKKRARATISKYEKGWRGKGDLLPHEKEFVEWERTYR